MNPLGIQSPQFADGPPQLPIEQPPNLPSINKWIDPVLPPPPAAPQVAVNPASAAGVDAIDPLPQRHPDEAQDVPIYYPSHTPDSHHNFVPILVPQVSTEDFLDSFASAPLPVASGSDVCHLPAAFPIGERPISPATAAAVDNNEKIKRIFLMTCGTIICAGAVFAVATLTPLVPMIYTTAASIASFATTQFAQIAATHLAPLMPALYWTGVAMSGTAVTLLCGYGVNKGYHAIVERNRKNLMDRYHALHVASDASIHKVCLGRSRNEEPIDWIEENDRNIDQLEINWRKITPKIEDANLQKSILEIRDRLEFAKLMLSCRRLLVKNGISAENYLIHILRPHLAAKPSLFKEFKDYLEDLRREIEHNVNPNPTAHHPLPIGNRKRRKKAPIVDSSSDDEA